MNDAEKRLRLLTLADRARDVAGMLLLRPGRVRFQLAAALAVLAVRLEGRL